MGRINGKQKVSEEKIGEKILERENKEKNSEKKRFIVLEIVIDK